MDGMITSTDKPKTRIHGRKLTNSLRISRGNGNSGLGKPEPLLGDLSGFWSRRMNEKIDWFIRLTNRMYISFHVDISLLRSLKSTSF